MWGERELALVLPSLDMFNCAKICSDLEISCLGRCQVQGEFFLTFAKTLSGAFMDPNQFELDF